MVLVKNYGKYVVKATNFYIYLIVSHNITQNINNDMLAYECIQGTPFTI